MKKKPTVSREDFATAPEHVRTGFERIANSLELPGSKREDFFDTWLPAHCSGDLRQEQRAVMLKDR